MSFRSVEMQIAIPRTNDAAAMQQQMSQKPAHDQAALAAKEIQQRERERQQSAKVDETAEQAIRDGQGGAGNKRHSGKGRSGRPGAQEQQEAPEHPYKGKHIDLLL